MGTSIVIVQVSQQIAPAPNLLQETGCFISQGGTNTQAGVISLLTQPSDLTPLLAGSAAISTIVWSGGTVVGTTALPHGIPSGAELLVTITGCVPLGFNGTWLCTQTGTSTFTYSLAVTPGIASTIGAYTLEDVSELLAMTTTFFAQGAYQAEGCVLGKVLWECQGGRKKHNHCRFFMSSTLWAGISKALLIASRLKWAI